MLAQALPAIINCILPGNLMKGLATTPTKLSAVAPCYNEAAVLVEFHRRMSAACASLTDDYEIVLVNDGSSDDSWPVLLSLAEQDPHVVAINLSRNHGQPLALTAGLGFFPRGGGSL